MIRRLTPDELSLWQSVMDGTTKVTPSTPVPSLPPAKIAVKNHNTSKILDLHGYILHTAYTSVFDFIDQSHTMGFKTVMIITGRSGQIFEEFPHWVKAHNKVRKIELQPNKGSWKIWLKKQNII